MDPVGIIKSNYLHIQILTQNVYPLIHVLVVDCHLQGTTQIFQTQCVMIQFVVLKHLISLYIAALLKHIDIKYKEVWYT